MGIDSSVTCYSGRHDAARDFGPRKTKEGLITGFFLFKDLRARHPEVPVIILSNLLSSVTLFGSERDVQVLQKADYLPLDLADLASRTVRIKHGPASEVNRG